MKNTFKTLGIIALAAIIGFSFIACDSNGGDGNDGLPATDGKVTITGLGSYTGKYVYATGSLGATILSAGGSNGGAAQISGSSVELKIWTYDTSSGAVSNFSGSGSGGLAIYILNSANIQTEIANPHAQSSAFVTFSGGNGGSVAFSQ